MRLIPSSSFARKMTLMGLLASTLASITLMAAFLVFDSISSRSLLQSRLSTLADIIGQNSTAALSFNDEPAAVEVLGALRTEPPVVSGCLYDPSGHLFAQYHRQPNSQLCPALHSQISNRGRGYSSVIRPVMLHDESVGTLFLTSDLQDLHKRWRHMLLVACLLGALAMIVGGIAGSFLQQAISKPISDLAKAMHEVTAEDNFSTRVRVVGNDEIAQLGSGFNTMLSELEQRDAAKKNAEAKLQFQALNDILTGLPNRRLFSDRLAQSLALAGRERRRLALLYIDLDGFKLVNDSLGHSVGDALLVQVADRLRTRVRRSDTLARLGGDEFTVLLPTVNSKEDATLVARNLLEVLTATFCVEEHEINIGASIGISFFPDNAREPVLLMQQADSAMYAAKRNGKNQARVFTDDLGSLVRERLNLGNLLRGAVLRGEIAVHYQPEFDVSTGRLVRFEALARWTHPTLGTIPPDKFIPVAEESGMIVSLGAYIMERACAEAATWQTLAPHPIQVAVNVSGIQFRRDSFVQDLVDVLNRTGLKPELLQIELTESVMLTGAHRAAEIMHRLHALGVSLAIDDFGTGYSCLSYLPTLPFDALKIDRSFVEDLHLRPEGKAMVRSLVSMAHNMGMRVIVEGIERPEQLELIREFGGNEIQGYLLGRPTPDPTIYLHGLLPANGKSAADSAEPTPTEGHLRGASTT